jgi:UDP-N-acetylglucosamine acyltransferase
MTNRIHPSAIVHPTARLGEHNVVGPWVVIGPGVVVGDRNWFGPGACVGMVGDAIGSPSTADEPWWEATSHHGHGVVLGNGIVL